MTDKHDILLATAQKLQAGQGLGLADGLALYQTADLWRLGDLAERITLSRHGPRVYYSINRHINYTNVCSVQCGFCQFSCPADHQNAYTMTPLQVIEAVAEAHEHGATEVHIVGGINPDLPFDYYLEIVETIHDRWPDLHIKAFTAIEIISLADKCGKSVEQVLSQLIAAGLASLPGGGAEILDEDYFHRVCPSKPHPDQWLAVHRTAHRLGLMTNCTMLYGHIETLPQRLHHLLKLRKLQDESLAAGAGHFQCFVPLPYTTSGGSGAPNALEDLRTIAISRLLLDNIDHVKAFWPMLGTGLAQVALCFGADDLDGTVQQYSIVSGPGASHPQSLPIDQLRQLISDTGRTPTQRLAGRYPKSCPPTGAKRTTSPKDNAAP